MTLVRDHARHFETLFAGNDDPWNLRSKRGERHKRETIRRALGPARLGWGAELGCGNGITTRDLAPKFAHLLAVDGSASAVALTQQGLRRGTLLLTVSFYLPSGPRTADHDTSANA